jgi:hypothetical protein
MSIFPRFSPDIYVLSTILSVSHFYAIICFVNVTDMSADILGFEIPVMLCDVNAGILLYLI